MPIIVFDKEPLSIVEPQPISELSPIITTPIWGYLTFFLSFGKKPKPFFPIIQPSRIATLFSIIVFLINTFDPIEQSDPMLTFFSIIVLWPIEQFFPILTFSPTKTLWPCLILLSKFNSSIFLTELSKSSLIASG